MACMNANGLHVELLNGDHDTVGLGDEVMLANSLVGVVFNWTKRGVAVRIDQEAAKPCYGGLKVLAFDVGDREIARVVSRLRNHDLVASEAWTAEEILRSEG